MPQGIAEIVAPLVESGLFDYAELKIYPHHFHTLQSDIVESHLESNYSMDLK